MASESTAELQRDKIELEQNIFELQAQLEDARVRLSDTTRTCEDLRLRVGNAESARNEMSKWSHELERIKDKLESEKAELKRSNESLEQDKETLLRLGDSKDEEINRLQDDKRELKNELSNLYSQKCAQQAKFDDIRSREAMLEHKEKRWEQEKALIMQEKEFAFGQLMEKERIIQQLRRDMSTKIMDRQTQLDVAKNENARLFNSVRSLTDENESLVEQCEELTLKLKQANELNADVQAKHEQEIICQYKLVAVHKESSEESEKKVAELTKALEDIQCLFVEAKDAHFAMQEQIKSMEDDQTRLLGERDAEIKELKDELEKANELLRSKHRVMLSEEEIAALSPGAAAAGKLIKSGLTLTQIYREHMKLVEELDNQKLENKRLEQYFRELVQDIEQKAPILKRQQDEYYRAVDSIDQMKLQLLKAEQDQARLLAEKDNCLRQLTYTKAELERYQRDNADLTSQVRELLQCVEKIRRGDYDCISGRFDDGLTTPEDLLLYRNIDELQTQNQRLLSALREAEAKREEIIKAAQDAEMSRIKNELLLALHELEDVKSGREKQEKLMQAIVDQRDTYERLFLDKSTGNAMAANKAADVSQSDLLAGNINQEANSELKVALDKLNIEFEVYRKEKCSMEKMLNDKIDKLQSSLTESRSANAKLNAEVEFQAERFRILENNIDTYKGEIKSLRERNEKYAVTVARQEEAANSLTEDLLQSKEDIGQLKAENNSLRDRFEKVRANESRLDHELQILRQNSYNQQMLTVTINELQARLERTEAEHTLRLKADLETALSEREALQRNLAKANQNRDSLVKEHLSKISELEGRLEDEKRNVNRLMSQLQSTEQQLADAENRCKAYRDDLDSSRTSLEDGASERYQKEAQQLQIRLNYVEVKHTEALRKIESLEEELKRSAKEVEQFRTLSTSLETGLDEHKKMSQMERNMLNRKITDLQKELEDTRSDNLSLEERLANLESEKQKLAADLGQKAHVAQNELTRIADILEKTNQEYQKCQARETRLKSDLEREMQCSMEHKKNLAIASAKSRLVEDEFESCKVKLEEYKQTLNQSANKLAQLQNVADNHEEEVMKVKGKYESELKELRERSSDLELKNETLTEQINKLANSLSALEHLQMSTAPTEELPSVQSIQEGSCETLSEVIKHLSEERSQKAHKLQLAETEVMRFKSRENMLQQEIDNLSDQLKSAQELASSAQQIASEKTQLMTRLEQMHNVQATNKALLQEKENLEKSISSLKLTISDQHEKLASMASAQGETKLSLEQLRANLEAVQKDNEVWKTKYTELVESRAQFETEEINKLRLELSDSSKKFSELDLEHSALKAENDSLKGSCTALENEKNNLTVDFEELKKKLSDLQANRDKVFKLAVKKKGELESLNAELSRLKQDHAELQKNLESTIAAKDTVVSDVDKQSLADVRSSLASLREKYVEAQVQIEQLSKENEKLVKRNRSLQGNIDENLFRMKLLEDMLDKAKAGGEKTIELNLQKPALEKAGAEAKISAKPTPIQPVQAFISDRPQTSGISGRLQLRQGQSVASIPPMNRLKTTAAVPPTAVSVSPTIPDQSFAAMSAQSYQQHANAVSTSTSSSLITVAQLPSAPTLPQAIVYPNADYALSDEPPEVVEGRSNQTSVISSSSSAVIPIGAPQDLQDIQPMTRDIGASKRRQSFSETTELMGAPKRRAMSPELVTTSGQPGPSGHLSEHAIPEDLEIITEDEQDIVQAARNIVGSSDNNDNEVMVLDDTFERPYESVEFDDSERDIQEEFPETIGYAMNEEEEEDEAEVRAQTPTLRTFELIKADSDHLVGQDVFETGGYDVTVSVGHSISPEDVLEDRDQLAEILDNEAVASSMVENLQPMVAPAYPISTQLDVQQPQSSGRADINIDSSADDVTEETTSEAVAVEQGPDIPVSVVPKTTGTKPQGAKQVRLRRPGVQTRLVAQSGQQEPADASSSSSSLAPGTSNMGSPIRARVSTRQGRRGANRPLRP